MVAHRKGVVVEQGARTGRQQGQMGWERMNWSRACTELGVGSEQPSPAQPPEAWTTKENKDLGNAMGRLHVPWLLSPVCKDLKPLKASSSQGSCAWTWAARCSLLVRIRRIRQPAQAGSIFPSTLEAAVKQHAPYLINIRGW